MDGSPAVGELQTADDEAQTALVPSQGIPGALNARWRDLANEHLRVRGRRLHHLALVRVSEYC